MDAREDEGGGGEGGVPDDSAGLTRAEPTFASPGMVIGRSAGTRESVVRPWTTGTTNGAAVSTTQSNDSNAGIGTSISSGIPGLKDVASCAPGVE
jgi:hypothetical protein